MWRREGGISMEGGEKLKGGGRDRGKSGIALGGGSLNKE